VHHLGFHGNYNGFLHFGGLNYTYSFFAKISFHFDESLLLFVVV